MLYATDTSTTVKKRLTAGGRAEALRLCPWGNAVRGFNGAGLHGERDEGIGLYMLGAGYRGYIPSLRRFNSPDSWSPFGRGGINAYAFCGGDSVNSKDPTGHQPFSWLKGLFGGARPSQKVKLLRYSRAARFDNAVRTYRAPEGFNGLPNIPDVFDFVIAHLDMDAIIAMNRVSKSWHTYTEPLVATYRKEVFEFTEHASVLFQIGKFSGKQHALEAMNFLVRDLRGSKAYYEAAEYMTGMREPLPYRMGGPHVSYEGPQTQRFDRYKRGLGVLFEMGGSRSQMFKEIAKPRFWKKIW